MTDMTQNNTAPSMDHKGAASNQADMLNKRIKSTWSKLSDDDVKLYTTQPDQFFMKLKNLCHVEKADAEKQILELKKETSNSSMSNNPKNVEKETHAA